MDLIREKLIQALQTSPKTFDNLLEDLNFTENFEREILSNQLKQMEDDGEIVRTKRTKYALSSSVGLILGEIAGNSKGFAFLRPKSQDEEDIFLPPKSLMGAFHKDICLCQRVESDKSHDEGRVVKIIKRGFDTLVATFEKGKNFAFAIPDDKRFSRDIFIPKGKSKNAQNRDKVVVKILSFGSAQRKPEGEIVEVLGKSSLEGMDILSIIKGYNLPESFPQEVLKECEKIPNEISKSDLQGRKDLRDKTVFTIDGADAKDLDDAVSIEKLENGNFLLSVHIADVSHYVKENSLTDKEARHRGTSVYFPDRVIPMLPEKLSNGICSLHENVDRLTLTVEMTINQKGKVVQDDLYKSVIRSKKRLTYEKVTKVFENDPEATKEYSSIAKELKNMKTLAEILIAKRKEKGAIDFDTKESKFTLEKGKCVNVEMRTREISNRIIEEFMILANETVASRADFLDLPFLYRIHQKPLDEKIQAFQAFLSALGINFVYNYDNLHSKNFETLLEGLKDNVLHLIVNKVLLRSMQKAVYSSLKEGHFGLSSSCYCHFTSPIRRYPDLFIHRVLKLMIEGKLDDKKMKKLDLLSDSLAEETSNLERRAEEIERDADELKKCEFMSRQIGEIYLGVISGVTSFGLFVELENTCEGLVRLDTMEKGNYVFDDKLYTLHGPKQSYRLGDSVTVEVASVELASRRINFKLIAKE